MCCFEQLCVGVFRKTHFICRQFDFISFVEVSDFSPTRNWNWIQGEEPLSLQCPLNFSVFSSALVPGMEKE